MLMTFAACIIMSNIMDIVDMQRSMKEKRSWAVM